MTSTLKYNLTQITDISNSGFHFEIPEDSFNIINYLCSQVGTAGITSSVFTKSPPSISVNSNDFTTSSSQIKNNKKKRGNKGMELNSEEWETIRSFQTTKIEQKTGLDGDISEIRLLLNKLTDKTFLDIREKIITKINNVCSNSLENEDYLKTWFYVIRHMFN